MTISCKHYHNKIEPKYIRILTNLYKDSMAKVKTEKEGKDFTLEKGVKQGDPISPKLFSSLLEHQFRKLKWGNRYGINIVGIRLTHLRFTDYILLVANALPNCKFFCCSVVVRQFASSL